METKREWLYLSPPTVQRLSKVLFTEFYRKDEVEHFQDQHFHQFLHCRSEDQDFLMCACGRWSGLPDHMHGHKPHYNFDCPEAPRGRKRKRKANV